MSPRRQEVAVCSFAAGLRQIKGNLKQAVPERLIRQTAELLELTGRRRKLTPEVTTHLALSRALHGGTAITHLRHLGPVVFTPSAYCQAMARLPVAFFDLLQRIVLDRLREDRPVERWRGHRLVLLDGSSVSMPDTPDLQATFGQPSGQAPGCGFPVAHLLALFEMTTGYLRRTILAPLATHDLAHAALMHHELQAGDVIVGDRALGSFAHLALLRHRGLHGVFRQHQRRPQGTASDREVLYSKPKLRPVWMTAEHYAALPDALAVREIRVRVRTPGRRVTHLVLATTLLDRRRYPARELAKIYEARWQIEGYLRSLKGTLGMDILRSKTADGVRKEVLLFSLIYNLVRRVMRAAADRQGVSPDRISFVDALRWLVRARRDELIPKLIVHPRRVGRYEPRVRKRRPKQYPVMKQPRDTLKKALKHERVRD
jgi:hypothetical protein